MLSYALAVRAHPCGAYIAVIVPKRYSRRPGETTNRAQKGWRSPAAYPSHFHRSRWRPTGDLLAL